MDFMRSLGRTGLSVSTVGLGAVKLGRNQGVRYPSGFELPTDDEAAAMLRAASDLGINLIDTAPAYGTSEERLGALMASHGWFGGRDRWVISTKVGEEFDGERSRFDFSPEGVQASVHRSLHRLRVDVLDIVLIHSSGEDEEILRRSGAVQALAELRRQGLVRFIGISSKTLSGGVLALDVSLDVLMLTLNAVESDQLPVVLEAGRRGAGVLIKKGLASGHAAVKPGQGGDAVRAAMGYIFDHAGGAFSSIVVGTINTAHLRHNVECARQLIAAGKQVSSGGL
jgi:aryl-alcohol dehydrogenase-like predicted oxidoreductase